MSIAKYFACPRGDFHQGESLNNICVDKECKQQGLICVICEELEHKKHDTMPLKSFLNIITTSIRNKTHGSIALAGEIDKLRASTLKTIEDRRRKIEEMFLEINNETIRYFDTLHQMAKDLLTAEGRMEKVIEDMTAGEDAALQEAMERIRQLIGIVELGEEKTFDVSKYLESLVKNAEEKITRLDKSLGKLVPDVAAVINPLLNFLKEEIHTKESGLSYIWSEEKKGAKIKISGVLAQQTGMESSGQRFILMDRDLSNSSKKKVWGIKIIKFGGWIGVGISLRNIIKTANYNFNYTTLGHGSYLISTNGYSWSHSVKEFNSSFKCFTFAVGDIVYIEYDPLAGKLRFRKNESVDVKDRFQLDVVAPPVGDGYNPSANLCSTNDSVQIVKQGMPLS